MKSLKRWLFISFSVVTMLSVSGAALAAGPRGFLTSQPAMLHTMVSGGWEMPIITVGDTLPNGYRYESIPDGLGLTSNPAGRNVRVYVSHETSLVPFPFNPATGVGDSDFDNAQVSELRLDPHTARVLDGKLIVTSDQNYQRFCTSFLADWRIGWRGAPIYFANEEATDFVSPPPLLAWPPDPNNRRQAGLVVAVDTRTGQAYEIPGLGRMNHENTVVVPGPWTDYWVLVTDDDTFSAPSAQFYMYLAETERDVLHDRGSLYAFRATGKNGNPVNSADPFNGANDYGDIADGDTMTGEFIPVPREIARGDQTVLENWSNTNNIFQFIRTEDIAYDKNDPRVLYIADTGEPRALPDAATGRLRRAPSGTMGPYPNGRVFKMVLNEHNPLVVDELSLIINADPFGPGVPGALHQPDNLETSWHSLMIQEDPGSHNNFNAGAGPNARVWRYDLHTGELSVVAEVDQSADLAARAGVWESSGILDVSHIYGAGTWLVNVQAHSLFVQVEQRGPLRFKREGGQMLLIHIPGS